MEGWGDGVCAEGVWLEVNLSYSPVPKSETYLTCLQNTSHCLPHLTVTLWALEDFVEAKKKKKKKSLKYLNMLNHACIRPQRCGFFFFFFFFLVLSLPCFFFLPKYIHQTAELERFVMSF